MKDYLFLIITIAVVLIILAIAMFSKFSLTSEQYDRLKWVTIRWSYLVTFIGVIVQLFGVPYGTETLTIVGAIGALLAGLLGISNNNYDAIAELPEEYWTDVTE